MKCSQAIRGRKVKSQGFFFLLDLSRAYVYAKYKYMLYLAPQQKFHQNGEN